MEPILFYGVPAGCSFGSIVALEWLGQPYRLCRIEMMEQPWDPLYAKVNPRLQTPALLTESGEPLTESLAILLHLGARRPGSQLGGCPGSTEDDRLNEMLSYLVTDFFSAFAPLWSAYELDNLNTDQKTFLRTLGHNNVARECAWLEQRLAGESWLLGGGTPTLADAYMAGIGRWIDYHKLFDLEREFPNLKRYLNQLARDPAVRFATAVESGEQPPGAGHCREHLSLASLRTTLEHL